MTTKEQVLKIDRDAICWDIRKLREDNHVFFVAYLGWDGQPHHTCAHKTARMAWVEALRKLTEEAEH